MIVVILGAGGGPIYIHNDYKSELQYYNLLIQKLLVLYEFNCHSLINLKMLFMLLCIMFMFYAVSFSCKAIHTFITLQFRDKYLDKIKFIVVMS